MTSVGRDSMMSDGNRFERGTKHGVDRDGAATSVESGMNVETEPDLGIKGKLAEMAKKVGIGAAAVSTAAFGLRLYRKAKKLLNRGDSAAQGADGVEEGGRDEQVEKGDSEVQDVGDVEGGDQVEGGDSEAHEEEQEVETVVDLATGLVKEVGQAVRESIEESRKAEDRFVRRMFAAVRDGAGAGKKWDAEHRDVEEPMVNVRKLSAAIIAATLATIMDKYLNMEWLDFELPGFFDKKSIENRRMVPNILARVPFLVKKRVPLGETVADWAAKPVHEMVYEKLAGEEAVDTRGEVLFGALVNSPFLQRMIPGIKNLDQYSAAGNYLQELLSSLGNLPFVGPFIDAISRDPDQVAKVIEEVDRADSEAKKTVAQIRRFRDMIQDIFNLKQ